MKASSRTVFALCVGALGVALSGCSQSAPYTAPQRGAFAKYGMTPARDPAAASLSEHTWTSREAASGGAGVGGSGCGCN